MLGIQESKLRPNPTVFHGIVSGHSFQPIGRIKLDVMFGKPDHFRTEAIEFEVVDLVSPYHALLGRPISKMAQTLVTAAEKQQIQDAVAMAKAAQTGMPSVVNPAGTTHFQPANDTKKILLDPSQPDRSFSMQDLASFRG
nr:uncharacterized protein LOC127303930 [Lolium perenne]